MKSVFTHEMAQSHYQHDCDDCGASVRHYRLLSPESGTVIVGCTHAAPIVGDYVHLLRMGTSGARPSRLNVKAWRQS